MTPGMCRLPLLGIACMLACCASPPVDRAALVGEAELVGELRVLAAAVARVAARVDAFAAGPVGRMPDGGSDRAPGMAGRSPAPAEHAAETPERPGAGPIPEVAQPAARRPGADEVPPGAPASDAVRELARRVDDVRRVLQPLAAPVAPLPVAPAPVATPGPPATAAVERAPSAVAAGRFQLAGSGRSAWQTVLDTWTGVVYNYRRVDGIDRWVPITSALATGAAAPR